MSTFMLHVQLHSWSMGKCIPGLCPLPIGPLTRFRYAVPDASRLCSNLHVHVHRIRNSSDTAALIVTLFIRVCWMRVEGSRSVASYSMSSFPASHSQSWEPPWTSIT